MHDACVRGLCASIERTNERLAVEYLHVVVRDVAVHDVLRNDALTPVTTASLHPLTRGRQ